MWGCCNPGFGCCPSFGCCNNFGGGASWLWIIIIVFIIFCLFCGGFNDKNCRNDIR